MSDENVYLASVNLIVQIQHQHDTLLNQLQRQGLFRGIGAHYFQISGLFENTT